MVCHRSCCSKILLLGVLYVAIGCNLPAQTASTRNKEKKRQEVKGQRVLSRHDSLSIENKKLRINSAATTDSSFKIESTFNDDDIPQIPKSFDKNYSPLLSDSLIPFQIKPSSIINQKDRVLNEYKKEMDKKHKLGEKVYKINPNAFKPTPGNIKVEDAPQEFETIYDGGHFKQSPQAGNGRASAPMPSFIVGGKKEVSKKDKRILKDVYGIEVK